MARNVSPITAVLDEDIPAVFQRLGLDSGTIKCAICSESVGSDNVSFIFSDHRRTRVVCDKEDCILKFTLGG